MMHTGSRTRQKCDVMRLGSSEKKCYRLDGCIGSNQTLLAHVEIQAIHEKLHVVGNVVDTGFWLQFADERYMIEPLDACAPDIVWPGIRITGADLCSNAFFLCIQPHFVAAGNRESKHPPRRWQFSCR